MCQQEILRIQGVIKQVLENSFKKYKIKLENNKHGWGRIKAQDHATLSVMHRPTHHSLCEGTYINIDNHSCCQSIYLNIITNNFSFKKDRKLIKNWGA